MGTEYVRVRREALETFCQQVFQSLDLSEQDARMAAAVLVAADARGIPSHSVARLWRYVNGLKTGLMLPDAPVEVLVDTPSSIVIHAQRATSERWPSAVSCLLKEAGLGPIAFLLNVQPRRQG